jgi:Flp pilus assembly protein TadG
MTDRSLVQRLAATWRRFRKDRRANVAVIFALALVPTLGVFGLGSEGSYWLLTQRAEQNAADAAVMAAAQAGNADASLSALSGSACAAGTNCYQLEGKAVATNYGFTQGTNSVTAVTVANNQTCPSNASSTATGAGVTCYKVTITKTVPLYFVRALGYRGTNGSGLQTISATAWAGPKDEPISVCVLALGPEQGNQAAIRLNGANSANLGNCTIFSDVNATCNGHNSGAFIGGAVGTDNGCGIAEYSNAASVADPDASKASNIPSNPCSNYQQESPSHNGAANTGQITVPGSTSYTPTSLKNAILNSANSTNGGGYAYSTTDASGDTVVEVCGDLKLGGNVTLASGNLILVVENGLVDMNGANSLATSGTAGMTAIFQNQGQSKYNSSLPTFTDVSNGTSSAIDISSPTSGTWSGVTIYDPALTGSYTFKGNAPAWTLSGIVYMPNADVDWRGIIGKADNGFECFDFVVKTLLIDGTAQMFNPDLSNPTSQCSQQGVTPPTTNIGYRFVLVE